MTDSEESEEADNSKRDGSSTMSPRSSRFDELLDRIPEDVNKKSRDPSTNSDTSRFDSLLDQIREDRSDHSDNITDDE